MYFAGSLASVAFSLSSTTRTSRFPTTAFTGFSPSGLPLTTDLSVGYSGSWSLTILSSIFPQFAAASFSNLSGQLSQQNRTSRPSYTFTTGSPIAPSFFPEIGQVSSAYGSPTRLASPAFAGAAG